MMRFQSKSIVSSIKYAMRHGLKDIIRTMRKTLKIGRI